MIFAGWVAIPRSILNHTHTSHLSNTEQLVFLTLMLLADAKTGSGHINAAALRTYLPELAYPAAKRVLQSLQEKRMIYRKITHASKKLYPFWIHGYQLSDGPHKMSWINLSQVFASNDVRDLAYSISVPEPVPEGVPAPVPEGVPEPRPNNNNDHDNDTHKDLTLDIEESDCHVSCLVSAKVTNSVSQSVRERDFEVSKDVTEKVSACDSWHLPTGFELRDDGRVYGSSGVQVAPNILAAMLEKGIEDDTA